jgi:hypothetical protein
LFLQNLLPLIRHLHPNSLHVTSSTFLKAASCSPPNLWHLRLDHASSTVLQKLKTIKSTYDIEVVIQWQVDEKITAATLYQRIGRAARGKDTQGIAIILIQKQTCQFFSKDWVDGRSRWEEAWKHSSEIAVTPRNSDLEQHLHGHHVMIGEESPQIWTSGESRVGFICPTTHPFSLQKGKEPSGCLSTG